MCIYHVHVHTMCIAIILHVHSQHSYDPMILYKIVNVDAHARFQPANHEVNPTLKLLLVPKWLWPQQQEYLLIRNGSTTLSPWATSLSLEIWRANPLLLNSSVSWVRKLLKSSLNTASSSSFRQRVDTTTRFITFRNKASSMIQLKQSTAFRIYFKPSSHTIYDMFLWQTHNLPEDIFLIVVKSLVAFIRYPICYLHNLFRCQRHRGSDD